MATHIVTTARYLNNTRSVLNAGKYLQDNLNAEFDRLVYAVTQLEEAATFQDTETQDYRAFMFSALGETQATRKVTKERVTEDVLATIVTDLQVGSVLVAAGHAVGEAGESAKQEGQIKLAQALSGLESSTDAVARGLSGPITSASAGRFNFSGALAPVKQPLIESSDDDTAINTFRTMSEQTMKDFVSGFREVAVSVVEALKEPLKKIKIMELIDKLGGPVQEASIAIGHLIKKGIDKIQAAIDALTELIGSASLTDLKNRITDLWNEIGTKKLNEWTDGVLAGLIGVETTRSRIDVIMASAPESKAVDRASNELSQLGQSYKDKMAMAKRIVSATSIVAGLLFLWPGVGQKLALFAGGSYIVVLAGALLIARDYCDSGHGLGWVRGVGAIADSIGATNPPLPNAD